MKRFLLILVLSHAATGFSQAIDSQFVKWPIDSIVTVLLPMVKHSLDSTEEQIARDTLTQKAKTALQAESYYCYAERLREFVWNRWRFYDHHSRAEVLNKFDDPFYQLFDFPSKTALQTSPSALSYVLHYQGELLTKAIANWNEDMDKTYANKKFKATLHISHEELLKLDSLYGEAYCYMITARSTLPAYAYEAILASEVRFYYDQKDIKDMEMYLGELKTSFPSNAHRLIFEKQFDSLEKSEKRYTNAPGIHFRKDNNTIHSIQDLLAPYKGKVVFLDFWGTWCHWCLEEFKTAAPALREKFKGKDVVFLYVARDEDRDDDKWKNDIFIYDLEGEQVRLTPNNMQILRDELDATSNEKLASIYPTYYIFDRQGKLAVSNAFRPGTGEQLYQQLEKIIEGNFSSIHNFVIRDLRNSQAAATLPHSPVP